MLCNFLYMASEVITAFKISFKLKVFKRSLGGNNKSFVCSTAFPISDLFGKIKPVLDTACASINIGFPSPSKSDIGQQPTK